MTPWACSALTLLLAACAAGTAREPTLPTSEPAMNTMFDDDEDDDEPLPPPPGESPLEKKATADAAQRLGASPDAVESSLVAFQDGLRGYHVALAGARPEALGVGVLTADGQVIGTFERFAQTRYRQDPRATAIAVLLLVQRQPMPPLGSEDAPGTPDPAFRPDGSLVYVFSDRTHRDRLTRATVRFAADGTIAGIDLAPVD